MSRLCPWLGKTVQHPEGYGIYFQQRWDEAIKAIRNSSTSTTGTVVAGKYPLPAKPPVSFHAPGQSTLLFVDQYNAEFNRSIQPMKGGYTDNYYMQMVENIRRYKGVRPIPVIEGFSQIKIDGDFTTGKRSRSNIETPTVIPFTAITRLRRAALRG